jgi:hypothetical protein
VAAVAVAGGVVFQFLTGGSPTATAATFVGSESCAGCHRAEAEAWRASQHRLAMQHATDKTVLGDFADASLDHYGVHSRFFRRNGKFLVETDGADGKLATFEVKYTFGVDPLQQYLASFPTAACRRCRSPGTAVRNTRAASAGSTSIPTRRSGTRTCCTGPS